MLEFEALPVNLKNLHRAPFFQNGAKSGFEMCFGPSTLGAGAKTLLESRIKEFTPHCVCRYILTDRVQEHETQNVAGTVPLAWCPCLSSSTRHAVCMTKGGLDLIKLYAPS